MATRSQDYTVAWICALPLEAAAAKAMLDEIHQAESNPTRLPGDDNIYTLGRIYGHNVVIVCLPSGIYGTTSAATVAAQLRIAFSSIRFGLMVGIGGGVPSAKNDIRLGDVVVSRPDGRFGGVIQYDFGKTITGGVFEQTGIISPPPQLLLNAVASLQADQLKGSIERIQDVVSNATTSNPTMNARFSRPNEASDYLYEASYNHRKGQGTCDMCDIKKIKHRKQRETSEPQIFYGTIASGNQVLKDAKARDRLAERDGILCFEMEATGLMNQLPCLVIRGICDYSDSHKNKDWQGYAAMTAASYERMLLRIIPGIYQSDHSTDIANYTKKALWMVPFERNVRFVDRHEVSTLEEMICNNGQTRKAAIAGLGGVGKTQIALELAYKMQKKNPECSIFWVVSTSLEAIEQGFLSISEKLGLPHAEPTAVKKQVKEYLSSENARPWILIIDNADDMDMWMTPSDSSPPLKKFIPHSEHGFVLFTTRNKQLATKLAGPDVVHVLEMEQAKATDLFRERLIRRELIDDGEAVNELLHRLCNLPLAIVQAASYINEMEVSLTSYLEMLKKQEDQTLELLSQDFEDDWRYEDIQNPVAATWLISFEKIRQLHTLAANYLSMLCCMEPREIPCSILPPPNTRVEQQKALGVLKAYSFITEERKSHSLSLHRLVYLATRNWLKSNGALTHWTCETGERLKNIFPCGDHRHRTLWRAYLPHAQLILESQNLPEDHPARGKLTYNVAVCLAEDGRHGEALNLFNWIVGRHTEAPEENDETMNIWASIWIVNLYHYQGRWTEAEEMGLKVLETSRKALGLEHKGTLAIMNMLAHTYRRQKRLKEAEELVKQVMEIGKRVHGPEDPVTLGATDSLATTYGMQGRFKKAEKLQKYVLETTKRVRSLDHPDTLASMNSLGITYAAQGKWKEAEELDIKAFEGRKRELGSKHPETLYSMTNVARAYRKQGRTKDAEELFMKALDVEKRFDGSDHSDTLNCMWSVSFNLKLLDRNYEAIEMLKLCVRLRNDRLGPSHPDTIQAIDTLRLWTSSSSDPSPEGEKDGTVASKPSTSTDTRSRL